MTRLIHDTFTIITDRRRFYLALKALLPMTANPKDSSKRHISGIQVGADKNGNTFISATNGHMAARHTITNLSEPDVLCNHASTDQLRGEILDGAQRYVATEDPSTLEVLLPHDLVKNLLAHPGLKKKNGSRHVRLVVTSGDKYNGKVAVSFGERLQCDTGKYWEADNFGALSAPLDRTDVFPPSMDKVWGDPWTDNPDGMIPFTALAPKLVGLACAAFTTLGAGAFTVRSVNSKGLSPILLSSTIDGADNIQIVIMPRGMPKGETSPWSIIPTMTSKDAYGASDATQAA